MKSELVRIGAFPCATFDNSSKKDKYAENKHAPGGRATAQTKALMVL